MTIKSQLKPILALVVGVSLAALLVWGFMEGRAERATEAEREKPVKAASRVSLQDGEVVVTLDAATQQKSALATTPLASTSRQEEARGFATVLDLTALSDSLTGYTQARSQLAKANAAFAASRAAFERMRTLNLDDKNVSDRALQNAQATLLGDEASVRAARDSLQLLDSGAYQRWGSVLGKAIAQNPVSLAPLLRQEQVLLQVALPAASAATTLPPTIRVSVAEGRFVQAQLVSAAPRADSRVQGLTAFYRASAASGLMPGLNVAAFVPQGRTAQGAVVPLPAIVWWQGRAWAYAQTDAEHFVRREVPTESPVEGGYFVADASHIGDRVVVAGAQLLLSEEFRSQIEVGEEGGKR